MSVSNAPLDPYFGKLDQAQKGIDTASGAVSADIKKFDFHPVSGGTPVGQKPTKYASSDNNNTRKNNQGQEVLKTLKDKFIPHADLPTTASALPGLDLAKIVAQVDPSGIAQAFPSMIKQFALIKSIMNIAAGGGGASAAPTTSQVTTLSDAFSEALCILCSKTSFAQVMISLDSMLMNKNGIYLIDPGYQTIVENGITNLVQKALIFGENNIPVIPDPPIVYGTVIPPSNLLLTDVFYVQNLAIKQYYAPNSDPYLGYITFLNNDGTYNYVKRTATDYPYQSVDDECLALAQKGIATDMFSYVFNNTLTADILNTILINHKVLHENNAMDHAIGKGTSTNLMSNLTAILGIAGTVVNLTQTSFLGKTILGGQISQALGSFSKNLAMAKTMAGMATSALKIPPALAGLAGLSSLSGALSAAGIALPNIASAVGGIPVLSDIIAARGTIAGIAYAVASVSSLANQLSSSGGSVSQINSSALGQTTPSLSSIITAMKSAGFSAAAIKAASDVLTDIGLV